AIRGLLLLMDGGLAFGVTRDTALSEVDSGARQRILAARWLYGAVGLSVFVGAIAFSFLPAALLHLSGSDRTVAEVVTVLLGLDTAVSLASSPFAAILRGRQRFNVLASGALVQSLVGFLVLALLIGPWGLFGASVASLVGR